MKKRHGVRNFILSLIIISGLFWGYLNLSGKNKNDTVDSPVVSAQAKAPTTNIVQRLFSPDSVLSKLNLNKPSQSENIMGYKDFDIDKAKDILLESNPKPKLTGKLNDFLKSIDKACKIEDVNPYVVYAQAMIETGWLSFKGDVSYKQNNFSGLGATGKGAEGEKFKTMYDGILAQTQHLKAYASTDSLSAECVDTRFEYVDRGSAETIQALSGKWASNKNYGDQILEIYKMFE